uniref:TonB-dependent receptor domain-containing protein n=1 Tax=Anaerospora hongkongensis TaxID=244830 RepID=UPI002FDB88DB
GLKWDKGNFANTLALFEITKPGSKIENNVYSYDGSQKNRGIEWNAFGKVADNVRLFGGITYLRGEITNATAVATEGNTPGGVPKWLMNVGAEWDTPWNPDLALSFRAVYTSSQYINNTNTVTIPSWVRYDLGAKYKTVINRTPVTFHASVENVFDRHYWSGVFSSTAGYVTLGAPRTFKLSATMQL